MQLVDFIFLKRIWEADKDNMLRILASLIDLCPLLILIFPEGTTISKETLASSNAFRESRGLLPTLHTLHPKSTGLSAIVQSMGSHLDGIYDLTLIFSPFKEIMNDSDELYGLKNSLFKRKFPREVHFLVEYFPLEDIPKDSNEGIKNWLTKLFDKKERVIKKFEESGEIDAKLIYKGPMLLSYPFLTWFFIIFIDVFWITCTYLFVGRFVLALYGNK